MESIYTIVKETTTFKTYSVTAYTAESAIKKIEQDESYYLVESDTIEPEYTIVNVEKQ